MTDQPRVGILTISDRSARGERADASGPLIHSIIIERLKWVVAIEHIVPDERAIIRETLSAWCDDLKLNLILTTGGTGFAPRDVTPEATLDVADKEMPGFGEQMRQISLRFVPTAILSRQTAVIRKQALILNLPGQPKSIAETLEGLRDAEGKSLVPGIFSAVPYCVDLIGGPYIESRPEVCAAFRPKSAVRPSGHASGK